VAEYLSGDLMKMSPEDGWVADGTHNWVLAGEAAEPVLIDARAGDSFTLARALPRSSYNGTWFDPATGNARDAGSISGAAGSVIQKPDGREWLLLLKGV
jgi:hypothetical protein